MRSLANAKPSLQAIASTVSGSESPRITNADAPRKLPAASLAMAAATALLELFETAASTLILTSPHGGGIHRGGTPWVPLTGAVCTVLIISISAIKLFTK